MGTIIKAIIGILLTTIIFSVLIYVYDVPIQKIVLIGFALMIIVLVIAGLWYASSQTDQVNNSHKMKTPAVMARIQQIWSEAMGDGNGLDLYTGQLKSIIGEDGKKYWGGTFDAVSGRHDGTPIVLIYCADDDDLCYINPAPIPVLIANPFHGFETTMYGKLARDRLREEKRGGRNQPFVNVDMSGKQDKNKIEADEFEKITGK